MYNQADLVEIMKGVVIDLYGVDATEADVWFDQMDVEEALSIAQSSITRGTNTVGESTGLFTFTAMDAVVEFVYSEYDRINFDYHAADITYEIIEDTIRKTFDYIYYSGFTEYEGENPLEYVYYADVYGIMVQVITDEYGIDNVSNGLSDDEITGYMSYIVDDLDRWTYGTMSTLDYTSTGEWYITTRGEIHDAVYAILATNGLDTEELLTAAGINDTVIDTIINGTVEILLHGYIWDWETDYWLEHLTWIINEDWD